MPENIKYLNNISNKPENKPEKINTKTQNMKIISQNHKMKISL